MRTQRWAALVAAGTLLLTPTVVALGPASAVGPNAIPAPWTGIDGKPHEDSPEVLPGKAGSNQNFWGYDFDDACWSGREFDKGMHLLAKLSKIIRASGRKVVWTVAPNKASALSDELDLSTLPHGACTLKGLAQQEALLRRYPDPGFVPILSPLQRTNQQIYWRNDSHWTSVGAAIWAKYLAKRLDPKLASRQKYVSTVESFRGEFFLDDPTIPEETAPGVKPAPYVKVTTTKGYDPDDPARVAHTWYDIRWNTKPVGKAWGGKTLLIGDSFTFVGLRVLRPLFDNGRFLWWGYSSTEKIARAINKADTVVLAQLQRAVDCYPIIETAEIYKELKRTLTPRR